MTVMSSTKLLCVPCVVFMNYIGSQVEMGKDMHILITMYKCPQCLKHVSMIEHLAKIKPKEEVNEKQDEH